MGRRSAAEDDRPPPSANPRGGWSPPNSPTGARGACDSLAQTSGGPPPAAAVRGWRRAFLKGGSGARGSGEARLKIAASARARASARAGASARVYATTLVRTRRTDSMFSRSVASTLSTYPSATATSRHAIVSRAEPREEKCAQPPVRACTRPIVRHTEFRPGVDDAAPARSSLRCARARLGCAGHSRKRE
jgi:hypothetical protein